MVTKKEFELIKNRHGSYASWAVWSEGGTKAKTNIGDIKIFEREATLLLLRRDILLVGLNLSRFTVSESFRNFHDSNSRAQDYKIRFAFEDTEYYGAYMTDIIKGVVEVDSKNIPKHLKKNPDVLEKSLKIFREELRDLGTSCPLFLAFGRITYQIIKDNLLPSEYRRLIRLTHYSHQISKEKYRETVLAEIAEGLGKESS